MVHSLHPVADWYFTACLKTPPKDASVFLSILETLRNPDSSTRLLSSALAELERLDIWQQSYALPFVLRTLDRNDLPPDFANLITVYFRDIQQYFRDSGHKEEDEAADHNSLSGLLDAILTQNRKPIRETLKNSIEEVARIQRAGDSGLGQHAVPYLALIDFLPQTILLASLEYLLKHEEFSALVENEWKENGLLSYFVTDALEYRFGRQAFILAMYMHLELARRKLLSTRELLGYQSLSKASPCFIMEADLVQVYIDTWSFQRSQESGEMGNALLDEYFSIQQLRRIILADGWYPFSGNPEDREILYSLVERAGGINREEWLSISMTYWQSALLNKISEVAPHLFTEQLVPIWTPSTGDIESVDLRYISLRQGKPDQEADRRERSLSKDEIDLVKEMFLVLSEMKTDVKIDIKATPEQVRGESGPTSVYFSGEEDIRWLFYSPWLSLRKGKTPPGGNYYAELGAAGTFLRLAGSFFLAQSALQQIERADHPAVVNLASFAVHCSDAISAYSHHLNSLKYGKRDKSKTYPVLSPAASAMALWIRRQVELLVQGYFPSIGRELFERLLETEWKPLKGDKMFFYRNILPKTMLDWADLAFPTAYGGNAAQRWFQGEKNPVRAVFQRNPKEWELHPYLQVKDVLRVQLVFRFLMEEQYRGDEPFKRFDWREGRAGVTQKNESGNIPWKCFPEQFLLTGPVEPSFWTSSGWEEDQVRDFLRSVRNIERWYSAQIYQVDDELEEQWYADFKSTVNGFGAKRDLHRFLKVRLLEILEAYVAGLHPVKLESRIALSISMLILEFGSPYDQFRLLEILFPHEGGLLKPIPDSDNKADILRLRLMVLKAGALLLEEVGRDRTEQQLKLPEQDAWLWLRSAVLQDFFNRLAYSFCIQPDEAAAESVNLSEMLKRLTETRIKKRRKQLVKADLERTYSLNYFSREGRIVSSVKELAAVQPFLVRKAVVDPNAARVQVTFDPFWQNNTGHNLFNANRRQLKDIETDSETGEVELKDVWAFVVRVEKQPYKGRWIRREFNCGLKSYLQDEFDINGPGKRNLKRGDRVLLTVKVRNKEWRIIDVKEDKLSEDRRIWEQILPDPARLPGKYAIPLASAYADSSAWFHNRENRNNRKFWTHHNQKTGAWEPYPFGLPELLLWANNYSGQFVMAFVREEPGTAAWVFSTQPGLHFHLTRADFYESDDPDEDDLLSPDDFFESNARLAGLLLTVRPVFINGQTLLQIPAEVLPDETLDERYPGLVQFDDRNLRWSRIFDAAGGSSSMDFESVVANKKQWFNQNGKKEYRWFIGLDEPVAGFPPEIAVNWKEGEEPPGATAIVSVENWSYANQLMAEVEVSKLDADQMRSSGQDLEAFTSLQVGDHILAEDILFFLDRPKADIYGRIRCKSRFGFLVQIETETLSFLPLRSDEKLDFKLIKNRLLRVSHAYMREVKLPATLHFDKKYLPSEMPASGKILGVVYLIGRESTGEKGKDKEANFFKVSWQLPDGGFLEPSELKFSNFETAGKVRNPVPIGAHLEGRIENDRVLVRVVQKSVTLRAIWSVNDSEVLPAGAFFTGADIKNNWYFEDKDHPGQLMRLLWKYNKNLEALQFLQKVTGADDNDNPYPTEWRIPPGLETTSVNRTSVMQADFVLTGNRDDEPSERRKKLDKVGLKLYFQEDGKFDIHRFFEFAVEAAAPPKPPKPAKAPAVAAPVQEVRQQARAAQPKINRQYEKARKDLEAYLNNPIPLIGQYLEKEQSVQLTDTRLQLLPLHATADGQGAWGKKIKLHAGEGPYLSAYSFPGSAAFILFPENAEDIFSVKASFRRHDYDPDAFKEEYYPEAEFDVPVEINERRLVVVGEEAGRHPVLESVLYDEPHFRFEWGYGKNLIVPSSRLMIDGQPLHKFKECVIAMMDEVTAITFIKTETEQGETKVAIDIKSLNIIYADSSWIYRQRKFFRFVHLLKVSASGGNLKIDAISGYSHLSGEQSRDFRVQHARMRDSANNILLDRLRKPAEDEEDRTASLALFGRLDIEVFERSLGAEVIFDHIWLSFEGGSPDGALPLDNEFGEILFFESREVIPISSGNDYSLRLSPVPGLSKEDVGKDFSGKLGVTKRQFSAREDTLGRVFHYRRRPKEKGDTDYFPFGSWVIARVHQTERGPLFSITDKMPPRVPTILRDMISKGDDVLVTVLESNEKTDRLVVELKPGLFIDLYKSTIPGHFQNLHHCPENLKKGDRMRVLLPDQRKTLFSLEYAAFSDHDYVGQESRWAVALPKNNLLSRNAVSTPEGIRKMADWRVFSIGGLPNVEAGVARTQYNSQEEELRRIMSARHPKIVRLWKGKYGDFSILSVNYDPPVGRLVIEDRRIHFVSLTSGNNQPLQWELLTFRGCTVLELKKILENARWEYHDARTGYWELSEGNKGAFVVEEEVGKQDALKGPLMFSAAVTGQLTLRPKNGELRSFGYPVDEIFFTLKGRKWPLGMVFVRQEAANRLWLEVSPGRMAEFTPQLVEFNNKYVRVSLAAFNWQQCREGDQLFLNLVSENPLEIGRLTLHNWISANRGVIGRQRCLAPFVYDDENGGLTIGRGIFAVQVPFQADFNIGEAAFCAVNGENIINFSFNQPLGKDQLIELTIGKDSQIEIIGHSLNRSVLPDGWDNAWEQFLRNTPYEKLRLFDFEKGKRLPREKEFVKMIAGMGSLIVRISGLSKEAVFVKPAPLEPPYGVNPGRFPLPGDTVFITENEQGNLEVAGFDYTQIFPDRDKHEWIEDPIGFLMVGIDEKGAFINQRNFRDILRLCGGALPVTMTGFQPLKEGVRFYFSRKNQINPQYLLPGQISIAHFLGMVNKEYAMLRCGTELITLHIDKVIEAVTEFPVWNNADCQRQLLDCLAANPAIWIRREPTGDLLPGFERDRLGVSFYARVVGLVTEEGVLTGAMMQSLLTQKLYWMPAERMSWVDNLRDEDFRLAYAGPDRSLILKVCLSRDGRRWFLSMVDTREVLHEFANLKPGKELAVRLIAQLRQPDHNYPGLFLAQTLSGNLLLPCIAGSDMDAKQLDIIRVTVFRKIEGPPYRVEVAWGAPPPVLDLPLDLWRVTEGEEAAVTSSMAAYRALIDKTPVEIRQQLSEMEGLDDRQLMQAEEARLKQWLFYAYHAAFELEEYRDDPELHRFAAHVAGCWIERAGRFEAIELSYAIMAVLLLENQSRRIGWNREAVFEMRHTILSFLHEISLRALRSGHIAAIAGYINDEAYADKTFYVTENLTYRWEQIRQVCLGLEQQDSQERFDYIRQFCEAIHLAGGSAELEVMEALLNATGETLEAGEVKGIIRKIANLQKMLPGYAIGNMDLKIPDHPWWENTDRFTWLQTEILPLLKDTEIILPDHFWR